MLTQGQSCVPVICPSHRLGGRVHAEEVTSDLLAWRLNANGCFFRLVPHLSEAPCGPTADGDQAQTRHPRASKSAVWGTALTGGCG